MRPWFKSIVKEKNNRKLKNRQNIFIILFYFKDLFLELFEHLGFKEENEAPQGNRKLCQEEHVPCGCHPAHCSLLILTVDLVLRFRAFVSRWLTAFKGSHFSD